MKKHILSLALTGTLLATSSTVVAQQMDPNMPDMQAAKPTACR